MSAIDQFRLDGKVAIVTGASSGLGVKFAEALAEAGADLVLGARRIDRLSHTRAAVEALDRRCLAVATDVSRPPSCAGLVQAAVDELGRVDILVNNAGIGYSMPAHLEEPTHFDHIIRTNLSGAWYMAQAFAKACINAESGGSIINISSVLGISGGDIPQAAYAASKAGMLGLTRDLSMQWAGRRGIRVNAIAPGFFESELTEPLLGSDAGSAKVTGRTPMGRVGRLEELSGALLLLASDAGSYITGVTLAVDGGWSLH